MKRSCLWLLPALIINLAQTFAAEEQSPAERVAAGTAAAAKAAQGWGAPEWKAQRDGIDICQFTITEGTAQQATIARIDRNSQDFAFDTVLAEGRVFGVETVSQMMARNAKNQYGKPLLAVNADFFLMARNNYTGALSGLTMSGGEILACPSDSVASKRRGGTVWIDRDGKPHVDNIAPTLTATLPSGEKIPFAINFPWDGTGTVLFTPRMGLTKSGTPKGALAFTTRTADALELVLVSANGKDDLTVQPGAQLKVKVEKVRPCGNTPFVTGKLILAAGNSERALCEAVKEGEELTLDFSITPLLTGAATAVSGYHTLLRENGGATAPEAFRRDGRNPRTFVGWNDTHFFLCVVDGRKKGVAAGMTFFDLVEFAKWLGMKNALELDGGGSSALWCEGKIINRPYGEERRPVGNAFVVLDKSKAAPAPEDEKNQQSADPLIGEGNAPGKSAPAQ